MAQLTAGDLAMIRQIMGRCHVGKTNRQAIKHFMIGLKKGLKTFKTYKRTLRKTVLRAVLKAHNANRDEYRHVMRGF